MVVALPVLLVFRALVYHQIGMEVDWAPSLHFGGLPVMFRSDVFERILLFSVLSFLLTLVVFYTCLLLLSALNRRPPTPDPLGRLVSLALGPIAHIPAGVQLMLPLLGGTLGWIPLTLWLTRIELLPGSPLWPNHVLEGLLVGAGFCLVWKYVVAVILALHLIHRYVHLGRQPVWDYADRLARTILRPLARIRLRLGKVDFIPLVAMAATFLLADRLEWFLGWLYAQLPV
jgi:uncharacterized protein YggT (Ycf19 family)